MTREKKLNLQAHKPQVHGGSVSLLRARFPPTGCITHERSFLNLVSLHEEYFVKSICSVQGERRDHQTELGRLFFAGLSARVCFLQVFQSVCCHVVVIISDSGLDFRKVACMY